MHFSGSDVIVVRRDRRKQQLQARAKKLLGHYLREGLWEECGLPEKAANLLESGKRPDYIAKQLSKEIKKIVSGGHFAL